MKLAALCLSALILAAPPASAQTQPDDAPAKRVVSESEMTRYLSAIDKLKKLGSLEELRAKPGQPPRTRYPSAMVDAVESEGFDAQSFTSVHWNVMMGYLALEMGARKPELDAARKKQAAQMEALKAQLPPEQYEAMKKGMSAMTGMYALYEDVPPENVALVKKHRAKLDEIMTSARPQH